jgi:plasmid stability protein
MASLTIRNLDRSLKEKLRVQAARHGHSMEEEVRVILKASLAPRNEKGNLAEAFRKYFGPVGGVDLELAPRDPVRRPPDFEE